MMRRILPLLALAVVAWSSCACTLPVFRSALEVWNTEPYRAVVYSRGGLSPDAQTLVKNSLQSVPSNLNLAFVDVNNAGGTDALKVWQEHGSPELPWMAVSFPHGGKLAWSGPLTSAAEAGLLDSPARKQLRQKLLDGTSVVWVLLESGDAVQDDNAAEFIQTLCGDLNRKIKLPLVMAEELSSSLPLKLEFSLIRVSRIAPEEKFFVAQLLQPELNPQKSDAEHREPLVFPVFGRGRALPAFTSKELTSETLTEAAKFLAGGCSCSATDLTPGTNLLIAADWEAELFVGKFQRKFVGAFAAVTDDSKKLAPDVIGSFSTDVADRKAGRVYQVKVENNDKALAQVLQRTDGAKVMVMGKLEDFGPDGEAKFLIVSSVKEEAATPPPKQRRKAGGI